MKTYIRPFLISLVVVLGYSNCTAVNLEKLVNKTDPKVVKVGIVLEDGRQGSGSGAIISKDGKILTCAHVVNHKGITKVFVKFDDGNFYPALVLKMDKKNDLALLKSYQQFGNFIFDPYPSFKFFKLGQSVSRGQEVLLFGSPLGLQYNVTVGWVENLLNGSFNIPHVIVLHSAFTNPGSSGGPLVDLQGRLVGLGEGTLMMNPFVPASGMGFAIDIDSIREFLKGE